MKDEIDVVPYHSHIFAFPIWRKPYKEIEKVIEKSTFNNPEKFPYLKRKFYFLRFTLLIRFKSRTRNGDVLQF